MREKKFTLYFTSSELGIREVAGIPSDFIQVPQSISYWRPSNLDSQSSPIVDAKVCHLIKDDSIPMSPESRFQPNEKPVYLKADIKYKNLSQGESTTGFEDLSSIIKKRGKDDDDCGHILAKALGGKMVDFNLFPQNSSINRGHIPWSRIWRWGIEWSAILWLRTQKNYDPMVKFHVVLIYSDSEYPDRPSNLLFCLEFYKSDSDSGSEDECENDEEDITMPKATLAGDVLNENLICNDEDAKVFGEDIVCFLDVIRKLMLECVSIELKEFLEVFIEALNEIIAESEEPEEVEDRSATDPPQESSSGFSFWDYVPIVGSIRTIGDAIYAAKKEDKMGFLLNSTIGVGGLALDVCSLAAAGLLLKAACKTAINHGAKEVAKAVLKGAAKGAAQQAAISAGVGGVTGGVLGGADGAAKGALRGALDGAIGGGLSGGTSGATNATAKAIGANAAKAGANSAYEAAKAGADAALEAAKTAGKEVAKEVGTQVAKDAAKQASKRIAAEALRDILLKEAANRAAGSCGSKIAVETLKTVLN